RRGRRGVGALDDRLEAPGDLGDVEGPPVAGRRLVRTAHGGGRSGGRREADLPGAAGGSADQPGGAAVPGRTGGQAVLSGGELDAGAPRGAPGTLRAGRGAQPAREVRV